MADKLAFTTKNFSEELTAKVNEELHGFLKQKDAAFDWPTLKKTEKIAHGDYTLVLGAVCGRQKINATEFAKEVAAFLTQAIESSPTKATLFIKKVEPAGGYLNFWVNRSAIIYQTVKAALNLNKQFGTLDVMKGKKVIVEHTSANPIGPLHIGNLRNVIFGGVLSQILKCVGYDVKQHFYVNDLGFQVGLTAIGFVKVYDRLEPKLKIDQWIGMIYAMMNTFSELQILGQDLHNCYETLIKKNVPAEQFVAEAKAKNPDVVDTKLLEYTNIFKDLEDRQPELFRELIAEVGSLPSIKKAAGELNLKYESNQPEAVKIFRKMVIACLAGMQETLDTYSIKHDYFDFESELGWEGSNDRVLTIMKASPYYVEPTQSNAEGKPEGGYFKLDQFIKDQGLPQGKKVPNRTNE